MGTHTPSIENIPELGVQIVIPHRGGKTQHFKEFEIDLPEFGIGFPNLQFWVSFDKMSVVASKHPVVMDVSFREYSTQCKD